MLYHISLICWQNKNLRLFFWLDTCDCEERVALAASFQSTHQKLPSRVRDRRDIGPKISCNWLRTVCDRLKLSPMFFQRCLQHFSRCQTLNRLVPKRGTSRGHWSFAACWGRSMSFWCAHCVCSEVLWDLSILRDCDTLRCRQRSQREAVETFLLELTRQICMFEVFCKMRIWALERLTTSPRVWAFTWWLQGRSSGR